ncbi:peptidase inhibitor family I36 protein [Nocardia brasiliensis]
MRRLFIAIALAAVATSLHQPQTSAEPRDGYCPSNSLCVWEEPGFHGGARAFTADAVYGYWEEGPVDDMRFNNGNLIDDAVSMIVNNLDKPVFFALVHYRHGGDSAGGFIARPKHTYDMAEIDRLNHSTPGMDNPYYDNKFSSHRILPE